MSEIETQTGRTLAHHLGAFSIGLDEIMKDYSEDSSLIFEGKYYKGVAEIRGFFEGFISGATEEFWSAFQISTQKVVGPIGYIVWKSEPSVKKATDTIYVQNGFIRVQTFTSF